MFSYVYHLCIPDIWNNYVLGYFQKIYFGQTSFKIFSMLKQTPPFILPEVHSLGAGEGAAKLLFIDCWGQDEFSSKTTESNS